MSFLRRVNILIVLLFYTALLLLFLGDLINSFVFVGALLILSVLSVVLMIFFRKNKKVLFELVLSFIALTLLAIFELPLTQFEGHTYTATSYHEPIEVIEGSNLHVMAVKIHYIFYITDPDEIKRQFEEQDIYTYEMFPLKNHDMYRSKMNWIAELIKIRKDDFVKTGDNVRAFLGEEIKEISEFLSSEKMEGPSAGLVLGLSGLYSQGKFTNELPIAVTGTLDRDGSSSAVGAVKEKLLIAEEYGLTHFILPKENRAIAEETKKNNDLSIELHFISHIDEAVQIIEQLNENSHQ